MISQDLKNKLIHSDVSKIFFISISLFLFALVMKVYFQLNDFKPAWFAATFYPYFGISNSVVTSLQHAWVLLVHFFVEDDLRNLLSSMMWLYFFGFILEDIRGRNAVFALFIIAGIITGIVVLICVGMSASYLPHQFYLGMKAPVMAIAAATIATNPQRKVFTSFNGGIPIYIVGIVFTLLTILSTMSHGIAPVLAIVVGMMVGILYHYGLDLQIYKAQDFFTNLFNKKSHSHAQINKEPVGYRVTQVSQAKIDELLDKINDHGINSLTAQEREWLKNYSNK
jgi:membrane associated rhomboid family serine protease